MGQTKQMVVSQQRSTGSQSVMHFNKQVSKSADYISMGWR